MNVHFEVSKVNGGRLVFKVGTAKFHTQCSGVKHLNELSECDFHRMERRTKFLEYGTMEELNSCKHTNNETRT